MAKAAPAPTSTSYYSTAQISPRGGPSQYGQGSPGPGNGWLRGDQKVPPSTQAQTRAVSPMPSSAPAAASSGPMMSDTVESRYESPKHDGQLMEKEDGRWKMYKFELRDGMLYKSHAGSGRVRSSGVIDRSATHAQAQANPGTASFISRIRVYEPDIVETAPSDFEFEIRVDVVRIFRAFTETEYLRWLVALRGAAQYNQVRENVRQTLKMAPVRVR